VYRSKSEKTWIAEITLPDGRRKKKRNKDKQVVIDWRYEQLKAIRENRMLPDEKITFSQFANHFLEDVAKHTLRPKTYATYKYILSDHVLPDLGKFKLISLGAQHLQDLYTKKLESGLSNKTVHHIHATIRRVLNEALKRGLIYNNPTNQVTPPRVEKTPPKVWTIEESQKFLLAVAEHRWYSIYLIALTTGARRGEILGMEWENINWTAKTISIEKTVLEVGYKTVVGEPKTKHARRTISLPQIVIDTLKDNQRVSGFIFQTSNKTPISPRNLIRHFKQVSREAELPDIRFHDLRHTAATILLQQDVHPKKVQELLGHSTIVLTLDTYSHIIPSMHSETADKMDAVFK
jgi:integrase